MTRWTVLRSLVVAALLAVAATEAVARPGGGHSYSGGSSSRSSGSSGSSSWSSSSSSSSTGTSSGSWVGLLCILFGLILIFLIVWHGPPSRSLLDVGGHGPGATLDSGSRDRVLDCVRQRDPDFSLVLFEDFACALYAESQRARHDPAARAGLASYWTPEELTALGKRAPEGGRVQAVVVGSLRPQRAFEEAGRLHIEYWFETNLHLQLEPPLDGKSAMTQYVEEVWTFSRDATVKTRAWTGVRKLGCPRCGAPYRSTGDARCEACGEASGAGRFDWLVSSVALRRVEAREHSLTGTSEEVGIDAPTLFAPSVNARREELFRDDPALGPAAIEARLRLIFDTLQSAWAAQELRPLRPFVSARQYDSLQYWIEAYKEQGLRNLMERPRLFTLAFARVERDAHYDALTLRIWANGCDYTVEAKSGRVVGGSRIADRPYSEYWTLVRSAKSRGAPRLDLRCPGCGAPLEVNMAGLCEHCGVHLTSGEFDWVLSKIEQDEAYQG